MCVPLLYQNHTVFYSFPYTLTESAVCDITTANTFDEQIAIIKRDLIGQGAWEHADITKIILGIQTDLASGLTLPYSDALY